VGGLIRETKGRESTKSRGTLPLSPSGKMNISAQQWESGIKEKSGNTGRREQIGENVGLRERMIDPTWEGELCLDARHFSIQYTRRRKSASRKFSFIASRSIQNKRKISRGRRESHAFPTKEAQFSRVETGVATENTAGRFKRKEVLGKGREKRDEKKGKKLLRGHNRQRKEFMKTDKRAYLHQMPQEKKKKKKKMLGVREE